LFGWTPLNQGRNIFDQDRGLAADDPYFLLRNPSTGEYFFGELGWPVNYRMEFDRGDDGISFSVGPREFNALRVVDHRESIQTPVVHLGLIKGDFDAAVQAMHAHIRRSVLPPQNPKHVYLVKYLLPEDQALTVYRGHDFNEQNIKRTMDVAAAAGAEVVIVSGPTWCSTYGDWLSPNPWLFPRGMQPLVEYAHQKGLLFGLYFEAEGGRSGHVCNDSEAACIRDWRYSNIYNEHPSWFVPPDSVLNLAIPQAAQYFDAEVPHIIDYYHLDLYRQDFNSFLRGRGPETLREGFLESDYWRHYEALYRTFEHLRETHPDTLVLSAAAGGMRLDLGTLAIFPQDTSSDRASYPSVYRMAAGLSTYLPPEVLNTPNGMPTPGTSSNNMPDLDTLLRGAYALGNTPMLFNAVLPKRIEDFKPITRERFLHYANLYKTFIRPLLPVSKVFHMAPVDSTNGVESGEWLAMEFASADAAQGWATVIRLSEHSPDLYSLKLKGLEPGGEYRVTFDNTGFAEVRGGLALTRDGLVIQLKAGQNSELLLFEQVQIPDRQKNSGD
jgi:alpha-galactosidase